MPETMPPILPALRRPVLLRLGRLILWVAMLWAGVALAQDAGTTLKGRLDAARGELGLIEETLGRPALDDDALVRLREEVETQRAALTAIQEEVAGPRDAARARLDKLGQPPKPEDPPESSDITEARRKEQALFGDLDGTAREAQVQLIRADQIANAITDRRREAFARRLTERSASIADPYFWMGVVDDIGRASLSVEIAATEAWNHFWVRSGLVSTASALAILLAGVLAARFLRARIRVLRAKLALRQAGRPAPSARLAASLDAVLAVLHALLGWPTGVLIGVIALATGDLLPERLLEQLGRGLILAVTIAVAFDATADGMLEVDRPALRLLPLSDWAVRRIRRRARWIAVVIGLHIILVAIGRAVYAPVSLTVAVTALSAFLLAVIATSLLVRLRNAPGSAPDSEGAVPEEDVNKLDILRPILWVAVVAVYACLLAGFVALASFFAFFPLVAIFVAALAYVAMVLIDATLTESLTGDAARARALAHAVGVRQKNIAFAATLLSGLLRFIILAVALMILAGPLGFYSADVFATVQRAFFGFQIGEITISPSGILLGTILFAIVLLLTRLVRRWVGTTLLPRTTLDAGLQNSIATIVGYSGVVLAIAVGLSEVGIDLQNFAIVAGALSVGIGFGLQSIVSNFVSGLILLAERPIRVGDIIAIGGEEGFVRRISVRATEIETYDRATLIIPNSQLITGTVKNWVYGNTWSRIKLSIALPYDSDPDAVKAALLASAADDPRILPSPPPRVFLSKLGDAGLEFELIVVVASVETMAAVRSDIQLRLLKELRERGLRTLAQQPPAAPPPVVVQLAEALAAVDEARRDDAAGR
jgi:small-conductance mechanosensitive channel